MKETLKSKKGITLIALVITIIILILLAGVTIGILGGENGIINKAKESKRIQKIAEIKEKIGLELMSAETDATLRGETLELAQRDDIASKYGTVDGDILTTTEDNYEIDLKEIYNSTLSTSGSYTSLKQAYETASSDLAIATASQSELATELQKSTATTDDILEGKKAYVGSSVQEGTMTDNGAVDETLSLNGTYTIPRGYHNGTGTVKQNLTPTTAAKINTTAATGEQTITLGQAGYYDKVIVDQTAAYNKGYDKGVVDGAAGGAKVYYLGTARTIDVKSKLPNDYSKLTADNFLCVTPSDGSASFTPSDSYGGGWNYSAKSDGGYTTVTKSYNKSTGVLTLTGGVGWVKGGMACGQQYRGTNLTIKTYVVIGTITNK